MVQREGVGGGGGDGDAAVGVVVVEEEVEGWGTPSLMLHPIEPTSNWKWILMRPARLVMEK